MGLTAKAVEALEPREKPYRVSDSRGLALRVDPSGAKYWISEIMRNGRRSTVSLGRWPEVSALEARRRHAEAAAKRDTGLSGESFRALALRWHSIKSSRLTSDKYAAQVWARLEADVFPLIGERDVSALPRRDLVRVVQAVAARGSGETARRLAQYLGQILDFAVDCGLIESHAGSRLSRVLAVPESSHHAALSPEDAGPLIQALWGYKGTVVVSCACRLLLLTAVRSSELAGARWAEIEGDIWVIPAERMKRRRPHVVPLSSQALAEFGRLRAVNGDQAFVFATARGVMHPETVARSIKRSGFAGQQTAHGLRSIFSTAANASGLWTPDAIERQLAHQETDAVRAAYHRAEYLDERRRLMQWWGDWVADRVAATAAFGAKKSCRHG